MSPALPRVRAIILVKNMVALIRRQREGPDYFVFPGGGSQADETPEQALKREVLEELGLQIDVDRLIAVTRHWYGKQLFFLCHVTGGEFGKGCGPEMTGKYPPNRGTFTPVWMPVNQLTSGKVVPQPIAELVASSAASSWPEEALFIDP